MLNDAYRTLSIEYKKAWYAPPQITLTSFQNKIFLSDEMESLLSGPSPFGSAVMGGGVLGVEAVIVNYNYELNFLILFISTNYNYIFMNLRIRWLEDQKIDGKKTNKV